MVTFTIPTWLYQQALVVATSSEIDIDSFLISVISEGYDHVTEPSAMVDKWLREAVEDSERGSCTVSLRLPVTVRNRVEREATKHVVPLRSMYAYLIYVHVY